jgi:glycine/D-amino acid oxidase-like deaminating enzyme
VRSSAEVVVVGGGIVGAACAYQLALRGVDVLLLDRAAPTAGASGAGEGNVLLADKQPGPELELARLGLDAYERLAARFEDEMELERKGALLVDSSPEEHASTEAVVAEMADVGVEATMLDAEALRELEPSLAEDLPGGALFPRDLQVWPMKVIRALLKGASEHGARLSYGVGVSEILTKAGRATGVSSHHGTVAAGTVVMAAGVASGPLLAGCGVSLPVYARKGQIAVTEPAAGFLSHKVISSSYMSTVHEAADRAQIATVLETTPRGNVLIGSSRCDHDQTLHTDHDVTAAMLRAAASVAPGLADLLIIRTYAGGRPSLPDSLPAIGRTAQLDGLIVATGHEGAGICEGPVTGELVADLVLQLDPPFDLAPFAPDRFVQVA